MFLFEGPAPLRVQFLSLLLVLLLFLAMLLFLLLIWVLFLMQVPVIQCYVDEVHRLGSESCGRLLF